MNKPITFKATENDLKRIENLKDFYQECWPESDRCSTTNIIRWSIGMLHMVKVERTFKWLSSEDLDIAIQESKQLLEDLEKEKTNEKTITCI